MTAADNAHSQSLKKNVKELSKHSIIYGVGVLSRLSSFILLPIHTKYLSQYDFGILTLVLAFIGITSVFTSYGLNVSFLRWYVPEENSLERRRIFSICYYGIVGVTLLLVVIVYSSSRPLAEFLLRDSGYQPLLVVASVILLADALFHFPQILLQAQKKSLGYVGVVFLNVFFNLGLNYYFIVVRGFGIPGVLYAVLISGIVTFIATVPITLKNLTLYFSFEKYRKFVAFGIPYVGNTLFVVLIDLIDRFLLERFIDPEKVALYSANYKLGAAMAVVVNAFRLAWHPFFLSISNSSNAKQTFARVFTYFLLISCGLFLAISLFINNLVRIEFAGFHLIAEKYWEGTFIIPWILFSYIIMGAYVVFAAGIHIEKKTKYTLLFTGAGIVTNVIANIILIPAIGIFGAAIATLLSYIVMTGVQYYTVQKFYHINYEFIRVLKILTSTAMVFAIYNIYFQDSEILMKSLLFSLYPLALFVMKFYVKAEWDEIKELMLKLTGKAKSD